MNKRMIKLIAVIITSLVVLILLIAGLKNIKVDEFHPSSVIFVVDSSASNQQKLQEQITVLKQICQRMDPEDKIKIIKVSQDAYLIYEGHAQSTGAITKSLQAFTQYDKNDYGTAYGDGIKKALNYAITMKKENYVPAVIVIGDLENEGAIEKQVNWNTLHKDIKKVQETAPELVMAFLYAHPQKLDFVKDKLSPVLGEKNLIVATEQNTDAAIKNFINALGR